MQTQQPFLFTTVFQLYFHMNLETLKANSYHEVKPMSATIFCTFDQQDIADLAMGRIRGSINGIHDVQYLNDFGANPTNHRDGDSSFFGWAIPLGYSNSVGVQPSRPVNVKIVCDEYVKDQVTARLVNQHAYRIVVS